MLWRLLWETSESPSYCPSFGGMLTVHRFTLVDSLVPCLGPFEVMSTERNFLKVSFFVCLFVFLKATHASLKKLPRR